MIEDKNTKNKEETKKEQKEEQCECKAHFILPTLSVTTRQVSLISSLFIFLLLITFITGFFWGQKNTIQEFTGQLENDLFTDKINYSFSSLYGAYANSDQNNEQIEEDPEEDDACSDETENTESLNEQEENIGEGAEPATRYYAPIIGFGTLSRAIKFTEKWQKKGYNFIVKERKSKSSKGKVITWYQVVTESFADKSKLIELIDKVKSVEKISEIMIRTEEASI